MAICNGIYLLNNYIYVEYKWADVTKGASFTEPYTWADIYDTAVDGGWNSGVIEKTTIYGSVNFYLCKRQIVLRKGQADTYFYMKNDVVFFDEIPTTSIFGCTNAYFKADSTGTIYSQFISRLNKPFSLNAQSGGYIELNNFIINVFGIHSTYGRAGVSALKYKNVHIIGGQNNNVYSYCDWEDVTVSKNTYAILPFGDFNSNVRTKAMSCSYGVLVGYIMEINMQNFVAISCTNDLALIPRYKGTVGNFTDCQIAKNKIRKTASNYTGNLSAEANFISTFNINIENGDGGIATLYDKDGCIVDSSTLNGQWSTPILYYKAYYEHIDGSTVDDTNTTYEPFTLKVHKVGYMDLEITDITIRSGEQTDIFGKMGTPLYFQQQIDGSVSVPSLKGIITSEQLSGTLCLPEIIGEIINTSDVMGTINSQSLNGDIY